MLDDEDRKRPMASMLSHEEDRRKARRLQRLVDFALAVIRQGNLSLEEVHRLVEGVRQYAYREYPDKKETYELLYTPRFRRAVVEKYGMQ
ncbi:cation diffusion facilitator family transporter [Desulfosoma caldarium]|uniref:Uncharacterized protein n=1 Tax=Desulfosoma caldarium TaxID=610254 RepID=A0A3N1UU09_9BACT|nr:hypothetical protein [Desulfosoma caldarium]ROQ92037.1 hypothetical protein EDC27_1708 [Desulfosoma caldarium]